MDMLDTQPFGISPWIAFSFFHVVMAFSLWKMADRVKEEPRWFAVLPLLNIILLLKIAKKPLWWLILFFFPIVNIVALIMTTMALCQRFGIEKWWGLVAILSPFNLILYAYLAYGTKDEPQPKNPA